MKPPLIVYIIWKSEEQKENGIGYQLATSLFSKLSRDIENPLSRGIGIPVFFRFAPQDGNEVPIGIDLQASEKSMVLALIGDGIIVSKEWRGYISSIYEMYENKSLDSHDNHRFIPAALSSSARNLNSEIATKNFINLYENEAFESKKQVLEGRIIHELCRLLYREVRLVDDTIPSQKFSKKINLFFSYSRKDGSEVVAEIKSYFDANTPIKNFLDILDIPTGESFQSVLKANIQKTNILLIIQTDHYSSREWCRWEVLEAKRSDRPIVVINTIKVKEERSFPYLGNVPVVRFGEGDSPELIFNGVLSEILRYEFVRESIDYQKKLFSVDGRTLSSPPELLSLVGKSAGSGLVIYPDPPITSEEEQLLKELENYQIITPTMLSLFN